MKFHVKDNDSLGAHLIGVVEITVETIISGKRKRARYILILNHPNLFASIELFKCRAAILLNIAAKLHPRNGNNVRGKEVRIKVEDEFLDNFLGVWCITPMMSKDSEGILSKSVQIFS